MMYMTADSDIRESAEMIVNAVARAAAAALREASGQPMPDGWEAPSNCGLLAGRLAEMGERIFAQDPDGTLRRNADAVLALMLAGMLEEQDRRSARGEGDAGLQVMAFAAGQAVEALWPDGEEGERIEALVNAYG